MKKSINRKIGKKYFNTFKGRLSNGMFFILPTILISPKKIIGWHSTVNSIYIGLGKNYVQFNLFNKIQKNETIVNKELFVKLLDLMRLKGWEFNTEKHHIKNLIDYMDENKYIILIISNGSVENQYIQQVVENLFKNTDFFIKKKE